MKESNGIVRCARTRDRMVGTKNILALLLAIACLITMLSACKSSVNGDIHLDLAPDSPREVYLTTSNLSEYLDINLELTNFESEEYEHVLGFLIKARADFSLTIKGKEDMIYKNVELRYRLNAPQYWNDAYHEVLLIPQDGNAFFPCDIHSLLS